MLNIILDSYDKCRGKITVRRKSFTMSNKKEENSKKEEKENEPENKQPTLPNENKSNALAENEIANIKSEVNQLSDNLQTTVTELKKSIVDIRSAVSEIENPFNLLRTISSEKDLKKLNGERLPPGVKSLVLGNQEETGAAHDEDKEIAKAENIEPHPSPASTPQAQPKNENKEETPETEVQLVAQPTPTKVNAAYLDWIWDLLEVGLKAADIHQLAYSCETMGYLPAQTSEFLYSLAVAAELVQEKGLSKAHLLLNLYKAAAISKANIGWEDMVALIAIAEEDLKKLKSTKGAE
jgi:hypothetical protein